MTAAADFAEAAQALADLVRTTAASPADQVRNLRLLAASLPANVTGAFLSRAAVVALCRALGSYVPQSSNEAARLRTDVLALLDAAILAAGDAEDDTSFTALRTLRVRTLAMLVQRSVGLASLATVNLRTQLPALAIAQMLYADGAREADLVARVDPPHPLFMPTTFQALSR